MTIIAMLLLLAAQDAPLDCDNQPTQADMNQCAALDFELADAKLNVQWNITYAAMKESDRTYERIPGLDVNFTGYAAPLLESQRAWLKYRDAQCAVEGNSVHGGSMEPMMVSICMTALTERRIAELAALLED